METEKSISLLLYDTLNIIGASENFRRRHQEKGIKHELLMTLSCLEQSSMYIFGSSCEGTKTPGLPSDQDILGCNELYPVVLNLQDAPSNGCAALLTLDNETASGYVKLQFVKNGVVISRENHDICLPAEFQHLKLHENGVYYWKDIKDKYQMTYNSGPALALEQPSTMIPDHIDGVYALRCRKWPPFANEWLSRKRKHSWPDKHTINHFKSLGFFVVRVGHPQSQERDIEWRVSFSLQERELMFDLNDVQYKCYVMLKLINHDLIKGRIGKSITSYHCKTCLFYAIEQNPQSMWVPDNLFQCVVKCLSILLIWARSGHCPNYFIPKENMFDRNVNDEIRLKVIDELVKLVTEGVSFLERIQTDKLRDYFIHRNNQLEIDAIKTYSDVKTSEMKYNLQIAIPIHTVMTRLYLLEYIVKGKEETIVGTCSANDILRAIELHNGILELCNHDNKKIITEHTEEDFRDAVDLLRPYLHTSLACHLVSFALNCISVSRQKEVLDESLMEFDKGAESDLTSGRLKYITFLYIRKKYSVCEKELISLEQKFESHVICPLQCRQQLFTLINGDLQTLLNTCEYSPRCILKHFTSASVIFLPTEIEIIPYALQFEMFRSAGTLPASRHDSVDFWYDLAVVDSKVYMYFLWYLVVQKMNFPTEIRHSIIQKLGMSAFDSIEHKETANNLLAWTLVQENLIPQAIMCMCDSWNILGRYELPHHIGIQKLNKAHYNAVKWQMLLLLRQIWFSKDVTVSFCFKCFGHNNDNLKTCTRCRISKYCSKLCQERDWNAHINVCKLIR